MKLLNFSLDRQVNLQIAGQTFDLHGAFTLQGYSYDTEQRVFTLKLQAKVYYPDGITSNFLTTDLNVVFDQVHFLRIQDNGNADSTSLDSIQMVDEFMHWFDEVHHDPNPSPVLVQIGDLFSSDEIAEHDWHNYMIIEFVFGVSILISSETVSAFFHQRNTLENEHRVD